MTDRKCPPPEGDELWSDLSTNRERIEFLKSGRAVSTGIIAPSVVPEILVLLAEREERDVQREMTLGLADDLKKAEKVSRRWRMMFEHAAQLLADEIEMYGLTGDEATEEIRDWYKAILDRKKR